MEEPTTDYIMVRSVPLCSVSFKYLQAAVSRQTTPLLSPIAQSVEHLTVNQRVTGSSPVGRVYKAGFGSLK